MPDGPREPSDTDLKTQLLQCRASLYDPDTHLPTLPVVIDQVRRMLDERDSVQVQLVRIEQERNLESMVGWERYDALLRLVAERLREILRQKIRGVNVLCQDHVRGDFFIVFLADVRDSGILLEVLDDGVSVLLDEDASEPVVLELRIGQGRVRRRPARRMERCIYAGVREARDDFHRRGEALDQERRRELQRILDAAAVTTLFQPVCRVPGSHVVGYEALSRGPEGSYLESAENLFGFAERSGLLGEVELLCVERAVESAKNLPIGVTVFINLSYRGVECLQATRGGLAGLLRSRGWSPHQFVVEITERIYAENPESLRDRIVELRTEGFRIAVDDMGTGYSSLHVVADLEPDYIKLDHMLVRDLDREPIKRNLVLAIIGFAEASQALVIAEGVERPEEMQALRDLGVFLQQGYFFGYPEPV